MNRVDMIREIESIATNLKPWDKLFHVQVGEHDYTISQFVQNGMAGEIATTVRDGKIIVVGFSPSKTHAEWKEHLTNISEMNLLT